MLKPMTVVCPFFKDKKQEPIEWFRPLKGGSQILPDLHKKPHTERLPEKRDEFLDSAKFNQEVNNLHRSVTNEEIETVIKSLSAKSQSTNAKQNNARTRCIHSRTLSDFQRRSTANPS